MAAKKSNEPIVFSEQDLPEVCTPEPSYASHHWYSEASYKFLLSLISTYRVLYTVFYEIVGPQEGAVDVDGSTSLVALFSNIFSYGLKVPFPSPIREVLDHLGLASS